MKKLFLLTVLALSLISGLIFWQNSRETAEQEPVPGEALTVLNYGDYIDREALDIFEEETGIKVLYEEATTPEECYAKYKAGAIDYDVICTSDYMLRRLMDEKELQPISWQNVPHWQNIGERYWQMVKEFDPELKYVLPYFWGTVGILYDENRVHEEPDSWEALFNGEYAGEIIMQNSMRDAYMVALKYQGHSLNSEDPEELTAAQELLLKQKPEVEAYFVDEVRDEMVAGNAIVAVCYSGEAYLAHEYAENLAFAVPKEGTNLWVDAWAITRRSRHREAAEKFLDFLCRQDIAAMNFEAVYYSTPNVALYETLPPEIKEDELIFPPDDIIEKSEVYKPLSPAGAALYSRLWKELKVE